MFHLFPVYKQGANFLPLVVLHLCRFYTLFLLWLIHDGSTLCNLLKIKEIACVFYIMKNIHGGLQSPEAPSWTINAWKFCTCLHYHWKLNLIIKKWCELKVLSIYTGIHSVINLLRLFLRIKVKPTLLMQEPVNYFTHSYIFLFSTNSVLFSTSVTASH